MRSFVKAVCLATALVILSLFAVSCSARDKDTVMKMGGYEVRYDLYRFAALSEKKAFSADTETDAGLEEKIRKGAIDYLRTLYAILSLAADNGIHPDDLAIEDSVNRIFATDEEAAGGKSELLASLKEEGLTEDAYRFLARVSVISDELYYALLNSGQIDTDEDHVRAFIEGDGCVRVKQILITTDGRTDEAAYAMALRVRELAADGADFEKLISEYGEDMKMFGSSAGYYLMRGVTYLPFEEAAFSLAVGEVSEVVKTSAGYSVIKRYEKDGDYIKNHFDSLAEDYYDSVYSLMREERAAELEIEYEALYDNINVLSLD